MKLAMTRWTSSAQRQSLLGFLIAFTPSSFCVAILRLDHGRQISTTKWAEWCPLLTQYGHRWPESRQGGLEHHTGQGRLWLRRHPSRNDQSMFHSFLQHLKFTCSQDTMVNEQDYVELGLSCADICRALDRGMNGKELEDLSKSACDAINQLTM